MYSLLYCRSELLECAVICYIFIKLAAVFEVTILVVFIVLFLISVVSNTNHYNMKMSDRKTWSTSKPRKSIHLRMKKLTAIRLAANISEGNITGASTSFDESSVVQPSDFLQSDGNRMEVSGAKDYCVQEGTASVEDVEMQPISSLNVEVMEDVPSSEEMPFGNVCEGRRIVDMGFLLKSILSSGRHEPLDCSIVDMIVENEIRLGLKSKISLKCKMCHITKIFCTKDADSSMTDVNQAVVLGAVSTGIGFTQTSEIMSVLQIPFMAQKTFIEKQLDIGDVIRKSAWKCMEEAGKKEASLAIKLHEVDADGIPCITVITDGAWSKRSYNINYNALSGVACIIGQRTSKLLFLGVRNKYCCICAKYKANAADAPKHRCFKNWEGASTSMESDIILEGFKCSLAMHGIKYTQIVGDGDSSVYRKIMETKPYGASTVIHKVECRNQLLRNFSKKIGEIYLRARSI